VGAVVGAALVVFLPEAPMRVTFEEAEMSPERPSSVPAPVRGRPQRQPQGAASYIRSLFGRRVTDEREEPCPTVPC
jgi:hypothetical protein